MSGFQDAREDDHATLFLDRHEAGEQLAQAILREMATAMPDPAAACVVYALPRGGLPIAAPIARALNCPLEIVVAKKITYPDNPELAIGAVSADGQIVRSARSQVPEWKSVLQQAQQAATQQLAELHNRASPIVATDKIALLVDDGMATGMTMAVAVMSIRKQQPQAIWICVPVMPAVLEETAYQWCAASGQTRAGRLVALAKPDCFSSVSRFYQFFAQVETDVARAYLQAATQNPDRHHHESPEIQTDRPNE